MDNTSLVSRRMGFVALPLVSVIVRILLNYYQTSRTIAAMPTMEFVIIIVLAFVAAFLLKILLGFCINGYAWRWHKQFKEQEAEQILKQK